MYQLVMQRLARFYWMSLATSGTPSSRVAAAPVSRLAIMGDYYGEDRTGGIKRMDLVRLTTMVPIRGCGLGKVVGESTSDPPERRPASEFSGVVLILDVDRLTDHAFAEVRDRAIRPTL